MEAPRAAVADPAEAPLPTATSVDTARVLAFEAPSIRGRLARPAVDRAVKNEAARLVRCPDIGSFSPPVGRVTVELVVDRTGDVFQAKLVDSSVPSAVSQCVLAVLARLVFEPPVSGLANVRYPLVFFAPPAK